ncbi:MAG: hypothetical protein OEV21_07595 [Thermoplasmata archaeon]|nr:hypothetical protein [Thermoplasmata archaeon]
MFELDKDLKTIILEHLSDDGLSISALSRILNEKGIKIHRLELSGYLKAMSDMNVLRAREVKPSKVFSPCQSKRKNIYEQIEDAIRQEEGDEDKRANLALFTMSKLFKRAVFEKELRMCGFIGSPNCRKASEKERTEASQILAKAGMRISPSDIAYVSNANLNQAYHRIIANLLIESAGIRQYISETKQKTLMEG